MGQGGSKVSVNMPSHILCFPYFKNEEELRSNCSKASSSLTQMREIVSLASELVLGTSQLTKTKIVLSATTCLFKFILDRLHKPETIEPEIKSAKPVPENVNISTKESVKSEEKKTLRTKPKKTLEAAFVQFKIDKAVANSAVSELHAKIVAIQNRYDRLLSEIAEDDRRLEVVPGLTLCEEVLELFKDRGHVFWKNPLLSAPFVVTFAAIYLSVAELSYILIPSYRLPLNKQILRLQDTLVEYKAICIRAREGSIKVRPLVPDSMIEGMGGPAFFVEDTMMETQVHLDEPNNTLNNNSGKFPSFSDQKEAMQNYKKALGDKYDSFFEDIIHSVRSFSGFKHKNNRPSGQLDEEDDETNFE